jgi:hypothetical protein
LRYGLRDTAVLASQIPATALVDVIGAIKPMAAGRRFGFRTGKTIIGRYRFGLRQHDKRAAR